MVYDISQRDSFLSVDKWIADAKELRDDEAKIVLAGNKADLVGPDVVDEGFAGIGRRVSTEEAQAFAD